MFISTTIQAHLLCVILTFIDSWSHVQLPKNYSDLTKIILTIGECELLCGMPSVTEESYGLHQFLNHDDRCLVEDNLKDVLLNGILIMVV